mmetsp:Transcript_6996/g.12934  ORF Transcript_6996/g.12934 Transcript_6996/m.12934 type:complete len:398 (-) Transcript_6996:35-1228(-)|eukprot:CAMPEP_0184529270 /NCGR_PEP_ID=MMETSP0198_2-20121128/12278_1 /TAXON_ID=1112570 /ORGANISM="Thraustochytrium sp., Strain LLF1b" /LENGTH=397 /DNA_ID=CAMNT_0026921257 /DNA_START=256 /DNA_END=1449 /DNA_ORIENTATION=+
MASSAAVEPGKENQAAEQQQKDEYDDIDSAGNTFIAPELQIECGQVLRNVEVRYRSFGVLNEAKDNCIVACHALTGNAALDSWWKSMLGKGKLFDDSKMFIVCANILGSCYGTCGPTTINPETQKPYGSSFPDITVRDMVKLHIQLLKDGLGVKRVACVVGGSLGGMQTLEWGAIAGEEYVGAMIPMCCGAYHHPWQIGISEAQRMAIYADPNWCNGEYIDRGTTPPHKGLEVARAMAMISYRTHKGYAEKFGRRSVPIPSHVSLSRGSTDPSQFAVESYLKHQGRKFCERFDALSYVKVTKAMDTHDIGRGRMGGVTGVLGRLVQPTLIISVASDVLYPPTEQSFMHKHMPNSEFLLVDSENGHDGFLLDQDVILPRTLKFLNEFVYPQVTTPAKL